RRGFSIAGRAPSAYIWGPGRPRRAPRAGPPGGRSACAAGTVRRDVSRMEPSGGQGPIRVLYVDDSRFDRELVRDALEMEATGFAVTEASSRGEFESALGRLGTDFDLVLTDFNILGFTGLDVLRAVRRTGVDVPVI